MAKRPRDGQHDAAGAVTRDITGMDSAPFALSACVVGAALIMLVGATAVFGAKYDYVGLERYYLPVRPLYFSLFVLPLLAIPSRIIRAVVAAAMLCALSWTVQVDGARNYQRAATAQVAQSPYGQWVRCFGPDPSTLVNWLKDRNHNGLVIVSNYHEYLALETGLPTVPIPPDREALETWLDRIQRARGVSELEVLFVIDPDNRWRSHWIPEPNNVITSLRLAEPVKTFADCEARVYYYHRVVAMSFDRSLAVY